MQEKSCACCGRPLATLLASGILIVAAGCAHARNNAPPNGRQVYMQAHCFACHGEHGFGGVGPRFRDDPFLSTGSYVVGRILVGGGPMPAFANKLDDNQIAAVATYIRNSWGNQFGVVGPERAARVRKTFEVAQNAEQPRSGALRSVEPSGKVSQKPSGKSPPPPPWMPNK